MQEELVKMVEFKAVELQINKPCHVTVSSVDMLVHAAESSIVHKKTYHDGCNEFVMQQL